MSAMDVSGDQCGDTGYVLHGQHDDWVLWSTDRHTALRSRRRDVGTPVVIEGLMQSGSDSLFETRHRVTIRT